MKRSRVLACIAWLIAVLIVSCEDIFVDDISDEAVVLLSPADSSFTTSTNPTLIWEELKGALEYELMIQSPTALVVDTTLTTTRFNKLLLPGKYQWCVKGSNGAYVSSPSCRTFEVLRDISEDSVILVSPANKYKTKTKEHTFAWKELLGASAYHFQIVSPMTGEPDTVLLSTTITKTSIVWQLPVRDWRWCVYGISSDGKVSKETCRTIEIIN